MSSRKQKTTKVREKKREKERKREREREREAERGVNRDNTEQRHLLLYEVRLRLLSCVDDVFSRYMYSLQYFVFPNLDVTQIIAIAPNGPTLIQRGGTLFCLKRKGLIV
jgi:hypothetical protein